MTIQQIKIGGKMRPVRFSYAALYEYENHTGRNAISDFNQMQNGGVSVVMSADLVFAGLSAGYRTTGKEIDFTALDVADWVFENPASMQKVMEIFADSFPKSDTAQEGGESEKKPETQPQDGTT